MIIKIFTVFDSKAEAYMQPFFVQSKGQAIRSFTEAANDSNHQFNKYPADFTLFELGDYDDATSKFNLLETPNAVVMAHEVKAQPSFPSPQLVNS